MPGATEDEGPGGRGADDAGNGAGNGGAGSGGASQAPAREAEGERGEGASSAAAQAPAAKAPAPVAPPPVEEAGAAASSAMSPRQKVHAPPKNFPGSNAPAVFLPPKSDILVEKDYGYLRIFIPGPGYFKSYRGPLAIVTVAIAALWASMVTLIPLFVLLLDLPKAVVLATIPLYSFGFLLMGAAVRSASLSEELVFEGGRFALTKDLFGWKSQVSGSCSDIYYVDLKIQRKFVRSGSLLSVVEAKPATWCILLAGAEEHSFAQQASTPEQRFILFEVSQFLQVPMGSGRLATVV